MRPIPGIMTLLLTSFIVLNVAKAQTWQPGSNFIYTNGNVGIGTSTPAVPLDVAGATRTTYVNFSEGSGIVGLLGKGSSYTGGWAATPDVLALTYFARDFAIGGWKKSDGLWGGASLYINSDNGNVLIGKTSQTNLAYKLDVNGNIRANKIVVNTTGADFVFDPGYHLLPLHELGRYIQEHHHLPGIQPAAEMQHQGLDLGDNHTRLLQKIEELTLYVIDLNEKLAAQQQLITEQAKLLKALSSEKQNN